jgi:hypothetical protein
MRRSWHLSPLDLSLDYGASEMLPISNPTQQAPRRRQVNVDDDGGKFKLPLTPLAMLGLLGVFIVITSITILILYLAVKYPPQPTLHTSLKAKATALRYFAMFFAVPTLVVYGLWRKQEARRHVVAWIKRKFSSEKGESPNADLT